MKSDSALSINTPGLWLVCAILGRPLSVCNSLMAALLKAHEISSKAASQWDEAPSVLVHVGTDERLDAHQIMEHWRKLQLPLI